MTMAFTLMTAMPPTVGHFNLMNFTSQIGDEHARVIVCTQPDEPFPYERFDALTEAAKRTHGVQVAHLHRTLEQNPEAEGFWDTWVDIMHWYGFKEGDIFVSSEPYGQTMADRLGGIFMPYDPERELYYTKATKIREETVDYFHDILPEFQKHLRTTVTVFGAESTGKTTLSKEMSYALNGHWLFEYARPYLELVGPDITVKSMEAIWRGQLATQRHAEQMYNKPFVVQDTDLFSTVGYWTQSHWEKELGPVPEKLIADALATKSDLYIITRSNIPFEEDPIRYGGDHRESPDEYWIALAEKYDLNYVVLDETYLEQRLTTAAKYARLAAQRKAKTIAYDRRGF